MRRACLALSFFLVVVAAAACQPSQPQQPAFEQKTDDVRRLAGILDYIAGDYAGAVKDGQILDQGEYEEQRSFLRDARALAAKLPAGGVDAPQGVDALSALVERKASPQDVATAARAFRTQLLAAYHVVLAPSSPPSQARAQELYGQLCASCHGATGAGDGPAAATLKPPPRNFRDPEVAESLSPARAFNGLTDGIRNTAMPSWGSLAPADRWSLAFYVTSLRHDPAAVERGAAAWKKVQGQAAGRIEDLANQTDAELGRMLAAEGLAPGEAADALAWLRSVAPFQQTAGAPMDQARALLRQAVTLYKQGDAAGARQAAGQAYLDGFEQHEGALRARDAELVTTCEDRFLKLRDGIGNGLPASQIEQEALQLGALLDRAEAELQGGGGARVAFVGAMVVILREGVEAALLLMLLLGIARRNAQADPAAAERDRRAVHTGWIIALGVGVITWLASAPLVKLGGASRELMEGIVSLIAAAMLLLTGHFVLARMDAKHRVDAIKRRLAEAGSTRGRRVALGSLAFVAVYREAFEVVLFLRAIALDAGPGSGGAAALGAGAGALLLIVVVALLLKLGRRLKPGPLLAAMGTLLCALAVVLAGKGVRALQEAGWVGIHPLSLPQIEWIGLFPSVQGVLAQIVVLAAFFGIAAWSWRRREVPV